MFLFYRVMKLKKDVKQQQSIYSLPSDATNIKWL